MNDDQRAAIRARLEALIDAIRGDEISSEIALCATLETGFLIQ